MTTDAATRGKVLTAKEKVRKIVEDLPDGASLEQILDAMNRHRQDIAPAQEVDAAVKIPPVRKSSVRAKVQEVRKPAPRPIFEVEQ